MLSFGSGEGDAARGSAGGVADSDFFEETAPRNTAENTAKHRDGGVGSMVANHRGGGEILVVVTTLIISRWLCKIET